MHPTLLLLRKQLKEEEHGLDALLHPFLSVWPPPPNPASSTSAPLLPLPVMGCGVSKMEAGADARVGIKSMKQRIEEMRRKRFGSADRMRKDSIVSTTGLLHPEEEEEAATTVATDPEEKAKEEEEDDGDVEKNEEGDRGEEKAVEENKEENDEGEKTTAGGAALLGGGRSRYDEEEQPGSPSFRVYFEGTLRASSDDESVNAGTREAGGKTDGKEPGRKDNINSSNSEESEGKTSKKHRAKRFKALTRGPSAVYSLLHVRACISHHSNDTHSSSHHNSNNVHSSVSVRSCYNSSSSNSNSNSSHENPGAVLSRKVA